MNKNIDPEHLDDLGNQYLKAISALEAPWTKRFDDPKREWRRLFSETLGTFFLVLVAAGAGVVDSITDGGIGRIASVTAPALMVMAIILFMGRVSGAHLNPVVTLGFAARGDFPWKRVPGYIIAQAVGSSLACLFLLSMFDVEGDMGRTLPGSGITDVHALMMEIVLTMGLVSVILGTASKAQNVGPLSALAVAGYIALAGLWASPISGASMNPARTFGPDLIVFDFSHFLVYLIGPIIGALLAVGSAWILRGPGGSVQSLKAAQGTLERVERLKKKIGRSKNLSN